MDTQNLVYRYDVKKSDDGVGGEEGTFCLCTLWCVSVSFSTTTLAAYRDISNLSFLSFQGVLKR